MRLIDADDIEFKKKFCKWFCTNLADATTCKRKDNCEIMKWIDEQPTAYDVDKVTCKLNDVINNVINHERDFVSEEEVYNLLLYFIKIIKRGGVDE